MSDPAAAERFAVAARAYLAALQTPPGDELLWQLALAVSELQREALWEWRFSFWGHWGRHAVETSRAPHALIYERTGGGRRR